jgi:glutamate/tyrosine decarboxylase-like PLP-dependent enzyme
MSTNGGEEPSPVEGLEALAREYGNRFLLEPAPDKRFPERGMRSVDAQNLHRNFIDHAEYPQTAEIEQRCIRMLADLFHAPGETAGARTQGSSEAIMLGALALKWKWRERRAREGKDTAAPNLVFGGDVHVVWEKFCRYFDVEPRIMPLQPDRYTIGPEDVEPHVDENTIGVAAVLGTTFTGHVASQLAAERGWMVPAYTLPPNADHVTIMHALVKLTLGHGLATTLAADLAQACETLERKGGLHELDRKRVKTGTGY